MKNNMKIGSSGALATVEQELVLSSGAVTGESVISHADGSNSA